MPHTPLPALPATDEPPAEGQPPGLVEMVDDVLGLIGGGVAALLPLFLLSVPAFVLLGLALIPLAVLTVVVAAVGALAALILAPVWLGGRALVRRFSGPRAP